MRKNKPIIVIPVYKTHMCDTECRSLNQCIRILGQYDIALVCPETFDVAEYENVFIATGKKLLVERFGDKNFLSLDSYSYLCLSSEFYKRFSKYTHMLIYQLDCWVFRDELKQWCDMGYDYIGAPWPPLHMPREISHGGNGGLSLRNISKMIELCDYGIRNLDVKIHRSFMAAWHTHKRHRIISNIFGAPRFVIRYILKYRQTITRAEDVVIAFYAQKYIPDFKFPDNKTAAQFSFDMAPDYFYAQNKENLPFGCHAWDRQDRLGFWKKFI